MNTIKGVFLMMLLCGGFMSSAHAINGTLYGDTFCTGTSRPHCICYNAPSGDDEIIGARGTQATCDAQGAAYSYSCPNGLSVVFTTISSWSVAQQRSQCAVNNPIVNNADYNPCGLRDVTYSNLREVGTEGDGCSRHAIDFTCS